MFGFDFWQDENQVPLPNVVVDSLKAAGVLGQGVMFYMGNAMVATGKTPQEIVKEIRKILGGLGMDILSMAEVGAIGDVEENGSSFAENSMIKARAVAEELKNKGESDCIVLADDSGLEVDYLGGEPGIYSPAW